MRSRWARRAGSFLPVLAFLLASAPCLAEIQLSGPDGAIAVLKSPAQRLITLSPHLTELVFAAGAGAQLIATVEYSEYPEQARRIPRIGDAFRLDLERIVSFKPDLVIAWHSGNPSLAIERLKSLGIATWSVEITRPGEVADIIESIGRASGNVQTARRAANSYRDQLERISARWSQRESVDYFYQVDERPLFTISGEHLISRGLALCGGHNLFAELPGLAPQVSRESVILANPRALIAPALPDEPDPLAHWREWSGLRAVQENGFITLPADDISRATPRFLDAIEMACALMDDLRSKKNSRERQ